MALHFKKFILNGQSAIFNDDPNCPPQILCEVITAEGTKSMAFIDVDSLKDCGIKLPMVENVLSQNNPGPSSSIRVDMPIEFSPQNNPGPSSNQVPDPIENDSSEKDGLKFTWGRSSIKCLMNTFQEKENDFDNGRGTKIQIWNKISAVMQKNGFFVTGEMCQRKWRTHTTTYKNLKEKNMKTGRGRDSWEYFDEMDRIFAKDPSYIPLATISCGVKPLKRIVDPTLIQEVEPSTSGINESTGDDESIEPTPKKQKKKILKKWLANSLKKSQTIWLNSIIFSKIWLKRKRKKIHYLNNY